MTIWGLMRSWWRSHPVQSRSLTRWGFNSFPDTVILSPWRQQRPTAIGHLPAARIHRFVSSLLRDWCVGVHRADNETQTVETSWWQRFLSAFKGKEKKKHSKFGSNSLAFSAEFRISTFQGETEAGGDGGGGCSWQDERRLAAAAGRFSPRLVWPAKPLAFLKVSKKLIYAPRLFRCREETSEILLGGGEGDACRCWRVHALKSRGCTRGFNGGRWI